MTTIPIGHADDIWQRARDLRMLAATWRLSAPAEQIPLILALIVQTGPGWHCLGAIASVWRGVVAYESPVALWWLLHSPTDSPCLRCIQLGRPAELMRPASPGSTWCAYHLGGRLLDVSIGTEDGVTVTRYAEVRA